MIRQVLQPRNLMIACKGVIRNGGSAGVDGMKVGELLSYVRSHRDGLLELIRSGGYQVSPIRGVHIPKGKGRTRLLGIPTVVDRWLQQAVSQQLAIYFELDFKKESYGFRPRKNMQQAVLKSQEHINTGYQDIVDIDLQSFFDQVPHYKLLQLIYNRVHCKLTLRLIRKWLRAPMMINGRLYKRRKGLPQGSPLSPLLSNILLNQLDSYLSDKGYRFIRYADDFSIYTDSKSKARFIGNEVYCFLRDHLDLPINSAKSGIRRPKTFQILGYGFVAVYKKGSKGKYQLIVGKKPWKNLQSKLKAVTKKTIPMTFSQRLSRITEIYRGWIYNFRLGNIHTKLKKLDEWLRNRLRYCIWHHWKKPERKRKNLIRMGVKQGQAYAWSRTRMGGWAVAQSPILGTTITEERLRKRGYQSMLSYYHQVKF